MNQTITISRFNAGGVVQTFQTALGNPAYTGSVGLTGVDQNGNILSFTFVFVDESQGQSS